jgi:hypothetical protein
LHRGLDRGGGGGRAWAWDDVRHTDCLFFILLLAASFLCMHSPDRLLITCARLACLACLPNSFCFVLPALYSFSLQVSLPDTLS